jgi:Bacterial type III secretion protein (HrpB4)
MAPGVVADAAVGPAAQAPSGSRGGAGGLTAMDTPPMTSEDRLALLHRICTSLDQKSIRFVSQVDPGWLAMIHPQWFSLSEDEAAGRQMSRVSQALFKLYGLQWPSLAEFKRRIHRMVLLDRAAILQVFALAALYVRRAQVRRCIGKQARNAFVAVVGAPAYQALLEGDEPVGPATAPMASADIQLYSLAVAGYRAMCSNGLWDSRHALALARLSLAPGDLDDDDTQPPNSSRRRRGELDGFEDRLPEYLPELAWLFGSKMDRALSV